MQLTQTLKNDHSKILKGHMWIENDCIITVTTYNLKVYTHSTGKNHFINLI